MGKLVLYGTILSPPVRSVMLTLKALELDYKFQEINFLKLDNRTEEYKEKNPQHTVPMLGDDDKCIWDSHAIAAYLVRKYAKNDALYPNDFIQRAIVDQRLHFESGVLFASLRNITAPLFARKVTVIPPEKMYAIKEGYNFLDAFLKSDYVAGDAMTIADFSLVTTVTTLGTLSPIDPAKTPNIIAWIDRMSALPYFEEINAEGVAIASKFFKDAFGVN